LKENELKCNQEEEKAILISPHSHKAIKLKPQPAMSRNSEK
jgi:hypothetical protein